MAEPFLSEIRIMSFGFPPRGWGFCNGQLLPINQNQALFSLLGTTFGGNGQTNFALPNLQGRTPIHFGNGNLLGQAGGSNTHSLTISEIPNHSHEMFGTSQASSTVWGDTTPNQIYDSSASTPVTMNPNFMALSGGSQPHENRQPFIALNFCIALQGIFPSPN
jgi:microcystin-dependent protein